MDAHPSSTRPSEVAWAPNYKFDPKQAQLWAPLLANRGLRRVLKRGRPSRGLQLYPGIMSDDPRTLTMLFQLATTLSDRLKPVVDEHGTVGANAIAGDFNALLTVGGYGMDPISIPLVDNSQLRLELGLIADFKTDRHREIASQLADLMFERPLPARVPIRREASTGSPDYVNDVVKKKTELRRALADLQTFLNYVEKGDLKALFVEFNAPIVQTIGERSQADKVLRQPDGTFRSKPREVNDELAARTGLTDGQRFNACKDVRVDGALIPNHFATRRRTVYGMAFVVNYVVAAFFASWREHYLSEYAFTWKHRGSDSILDKMKKYEYMAGFDVTQFDQSCPAFLVDFFCDKIGEHSDLRIAKLVRMMFMAPYIMPYSHIAGSSTEPQNPLYGADPFDSASFSMKLGLPSGISCNPDFGKFAMVFQYLCICDDYYRDVLEVGLARILRGEHTAFALLNMGDDCVICTNDKTFAAHVTNAKYTADYFAVAKESPISFLGNIPYRAGDGSLNLAPNIGSFFLNWLVPEFGVDNHRRRDFWAVGDRERRLHYALAPSYPEAYAIYEEIFRDAWDRTPASITAEYYDKQRSFSLMSFIDALVLQNPDYLHYRYDEADVSPDVLELLVTSIPADEVWSCTRAFFRSPLTS